MSSFSHKRVAPLEKANDIIEIRPSRFLRIQHHNARPRDEQFEKEMGIFMQYKKSGIPSSGPLTMSKRMISSNVTSHSSKLHSSSNPTNIENSPVNMENEKPQNKAIIKNDLVTEDPASSSVPEDDIPTSYVNPSVSSSLMSSPCHTKSSNKIQSASSVLVALHMSQQESLSATKDSVNSDTPLFKRTDHKKEVPFNSDRDQNPLSDEANKTSTKDGNLEDIGEGNNQGNGLNGFTNNLNNASVNTDFVLFFIHGVGGSSDIWCAQIHYFAQKGYEIIAPDLIGHGFSCCPKNAKAYHFKEIAADVEEIFDKYCKKRNVVIGHSYGGSFATLLARSRSRRIHNLVLVSSGPPTPLAPQPGVFTLPMCLLGCIKPCLLCGFKRGAFYKKRKPVISKKNAFCIPTNVLQHTMNGQDWADGDEIYHNWLTCECLLIYGSEDRLVSLEDEIDTQKAIFNSHLEVVKEASHMVMMEAPNEVNELLANFIDQTQALRNPNQDSQSNNVSESVVHSSPFKRQKSAISLKSHVQKKLK